MLHNFRNEKVKVVIKPIFEKDCAKVAAGLKPDRAWETDIYVTRRCNLNCSYCYIKEYFDRGLEFKDPPLEMLYSLLDKLADKTYGLVVLGGEPLIRRDLDLVLQHARDVGIPSIRIATNGVFIRQSKEAIRLLDRMNISLDAMRKKQYPEIMEKMLKDAVAVKEEMGDAFPQVCISYTLSGQENFDLDIAPIADFCQEHGFKIKFIPCKYPNLHVNWEQLNEVVKYILANYPADMLLNISELTAQINDEFLFKNCLQGMQFYIDFEGNFLYPCDEYPDQKAGKIFDYTLDELYRMGQEKFGLYPNAQNNTCRECKSYCHAENSFNYRHPRRQLDILSS